jgi:hypothetical protein
MMVCVHAVNACCAVCVYDCEFAVVDGRGTSAQVNRLTKKMMYIHACKTQPLSKLCYPTLLVRKDCNMRRLARRTPVTMRDTVLSYRRRW